MALNYTIYQYDGSRNQALPEDVRNKLVIKVVETKTRTMILFLL